MFRKTSKPTRKDVTVRVRVSLEQRTMFADAAAKAGLDLSSWLRFIAMKKVAK